MTGATGALIWIIVAAALFIIEGATTQLVGIWFAVGAVIAIFPAILGAPPWLQLLVFLISSIVFLFAIRPVLRDKLAVKKQPTNADMVVGKTGIVLEEIDNLKGAGRVSAMGLTWTARSEEDGVIAKDTRVLVKRIDGVKLIVVPEGEE